MTDPQMLSLIASFAAIAAMAFAAYSDWRTREVPDYVWIILGAAGLVITGFRVMCDGFDLGCMLMLIGSALILFDICVDIDRPVAVSVIFYVVMAALFIIPFFIEHNQYMESLYAIPACFILFYLMFIFGILRGGADAKCFMVMPMVFSVYPAFGVFPLISIPTGMISKVFIFPLALLFHAALFAVIGMILFGIANSAKNKGPKGMNTFLWKRMAIADARNVHVWPKQDYIEGNVCYLSGITDDKEVYDRMEAAGEKEIWVTPIIPFMVPAFAALVFMIFIGNILFIPF